MIYLVNVLTNRKRGFKTLKKYKSYDKAKAYYDKMCLEDAGAGYFLTQEEG